MANTLERLTSEISVILLISISLILFATTFEETIGTKIANIYYGMLIFVGFTYFARKQGIITSNINPISGNSGKSLLWAGGALIAFTALYSFVNALFRQSVLPVQATQAELSQSVFQSAFGGLVKLSAVDFSQLTPVKYYLFGFNIPLIETLTLVAGLIWLVWAFNLTWDIRNPRIYALITILSGLFMFFHLKVRGVNNNLDLAMTFVFAFISLVIVVILKEAEAANEFHVGTNVLALIYGR